MSKCDIELLEKLKPFYKNKEDLDNALIDFKGQVENLFDEATREGIDPVKMVAKRIDENVKQIEFEAYRRILQVQASKKAEDFVGQFSNAENGIRGLFYTRHGENYEGIGSLEQYKAADSNRRIGKLKRELGVDGERILKRLKDADPDLELQVRQLEYGEIDQAAMGRMDPDAIKMHKAIKSLNMYDFKTKRLTGADVKFQKNRLHRQNHNPRNMREMGQKAWVDKAISYMDDTPILNRIKRSRKLVSEGIEGLDAETKEIAKLADSPQPVRDYLELHYEKIILNESRKGLNIDDNFMGLQFDTRRKSLESSTFFKFKNAEAEMKYNREVNGTSLFESLSQDIIRDSGSVASMKVLGPNPNLTMEKLITKYGIENGQQIKAEFRFASGRKAGTSNSMMARAAEKARKLTDMALLSTSLASTLPDLAIGAYVISSKTGRNYFGTMHDIVKENIKLLSGNRRREYMRRLNILMDDELFDFHRIGEDGKFNTDLDPFKSEILTDSPAKRLVEGVGRKVGGAIDYTHNKVMRMTGLPTQSQIMRTASVKNFAMYLADIKGQNLSDMYKGTKSLFDRVGINEKDWDLLRTKAVKEGPDGSVFLDAESILDLTKEDVGITNEAYFERYIFKLNDKVSSMYDFLANTSSPTPGVRSKAWVETIPPDTVAGVLVRTVAQYKSFSISVYNSLREAYGDRLDKDRNLKLAQTMITGMGLAYIGLSAKEGLKGESVELPDLSSPQDIARFSAGLLARSGTAGLMFDFISSDYNSPWRSLAGDILGPSPRVVESGLNISKYPLDMLMSRNEKDRKKANKYLLNNLERLSPSIPFTRTLINENLFDIIHKSLNTGARR